MRKYLVPLLGLILAHCVHGEEAEAVEEVKEVRKEPYKDPVLVKKEAVLFWETFQPSQGSNLESLGWVLSTKEEYSEQVPLVDEMDSAYEGDKALLLTKKHVRYGLSKKLEKPISLQEEDLIVQFESRFHDKLSCSGSYIKFVAEDSETDQNSFNEKTPYVLMFGPDKCGNNAKLHVILRHQNPVTKEFEEKHMNDIGKFSNDKNTHVYTLHLKKSDQTAKVFVDREEKGTASASSLEGFSPSFIPPKQVDDPEDKKPEDWVDEVQIADPDVKKPEDWVDEETIEDPESKKPEDWDDEEDGEWQPAIIPNPEYKGPWNAPMIDNPLYKGEWKPKTIDNPAYFDQENPLSTLPKITHVFIEVLANDENIAFDNILITTDPETAKAVAAEHSLSKQKIEKEIMTERELKQKKEERDKKLQEEFGVSSVLNYISGELGEFYERQPFVVAGGTGVTLIVVFYLFLWKPKDRTKKNEEEKKGATTPKEESKKDKKSDDDEEEEDVVDLTAESEAKIEKQEGVRRRPRRAD